MRKQIWKRLGWSITALEDKKKCFAWLFFFFVLQLILQYYYPMTSDDLYFRYGVEISNKNDLFNYVLHFGNGRYLGNSSVLILVRCHWLRALSKAVIMTAIYGELIYLLDLKNELQIAFAGILMLLLSVKMYAQVYVWTAGFQNYIVPIFLYLTAILCWKKCKEAKENGRKILLGAMIFLTAAPAQLFSENCTLFFAIASVGIGAVEVWKNKKIRKSTIILVVGSILGAGIMTAGPMLLKGDMGGQSNYRKVPRTLEAVFETIYQNGALAGRYLLGCTGLWSIMAILDCISLERLHQDKNRVWTQLRVVAGCGLAGFSVIHLIAMDEIVRPDLPKVYFFLFLVEMGYMIGHSWNYFKIGKGDAAILTGAGIFTVLPLLVVTPVSARVFYLTWFIWLMAVLKSISVEGLKRSLVAIRMLMLGMSAGLIIIALEWNAVDTVRMTYVNRLMRENPKRESIVLPELPNSRLLQADADGAYWNYVLHSLGGGKEQISVEWRNWYHWLNVKEPADTEN